jgi:hypothetical protein
MRSSAIRGRAAPIDCLVALSQAFRIGLVPAAFSWTPRTREDGRFAAMFPPAGPVEVTAPPPRIDAPDVLLRQLMALIAPFDPLELIADVLWLNATPAWELYDAEQAGSMAFVEYLAELVALMGLEPLSRPRAPRAEVIQANRLIAEIFGLTQDASAPSGEAGHSSLRSNVLRYHLYVRYPGNAAHVAEETELLGRRADDVMRGAIGWGMVDAVRTIEGVRQATATESSGLRGSGRGFRRSAKRQFTVSGESVSRFSGLSTALVEAILRDLTLDPASARKLPTPTPAIQRQPLLALGGGTWFVPVPSLLPYAIRPRAEELLTSRAPERWNDYNKRRCDFVEARSLELLTQIVRPDIVHSNLVYGGGEIDGLMQLDDHVLVVEAKSSTLSLPARRAAPDTTGEELAAIVSKARSQTARAIDYLVAAETAVFGTPAGRVELDSTSMHFAHRILVTLDSMDAYVANSAMLDSAIGQDDGPVPFFACSLTDLRVLKDLVEWPCQFIHYLEKRSRLASQSRVIATEELDWFGFYLQHNLDVEFILDSDVEVIVNFGDFTPAIARFYAGQRGVAPPSRPPRQPMPKLMRRMLEETQANVAPGYLRACVLALDIPMKDRWKVFRAYAQQRIRSSADGRVHDIVARPLGCRTGFSMHFGALNQLDWLMGQARACTNEVSDRAGLERWLSLVAVNEAPWVCSLAVATDGSASALRPIERVSGEGNADVE